MSNNPTEVLEEQISKVRAEITQNKISIADLFVKIHRNNSFVTLDPEPFFKTLKEMDKMPKLLDELTKNESKLEVLVNSKAEIEKVCCCC